MFDFSTVKGPYQAVMDGRWEDLEEIFDNDERFSISYPIMTVAEDNAFHIAVHSKSEKPLKQLLERLEDHDQMRTDALHTFNAYENTVIQEAAISNNIAAVKLLVEGGYVTDEQLLKRNKSGQTPLFKAAAFGSTKVVKYLASRPNQMINTSDNKKQLHNNHRTRKDTTSILHAAVQGEHFGTALWLLKMDKGLAKLKTEENGMTSLHLLTNLKTAFTHKFGNHFWHRFLYYCIPTGNDENDDADNIDDNSDNMDDNSEDDQHDSDNQNPPPQWKKSLKTINKSFWKYFIGDSRWPIARKIWIKKRKCNFALKLARELIKNDRSWLQSYTQETMASFKSLDDEGPISNIKIDHEDPRTISIISLEDERPIPIKSPEDERPIYNIKNISFEDKNDSQASLKEQPDDQLKEIPIKEDNKPVETPLLAATKTGVIKIVKEILKIHPQAVEHVSHKRQNILHVAASYRRREVFDLVKQMQMQTSRLILGIDEDGYSVLHHVADNKNYTGGTSPGPAYQLQKELEWFKSVEEIMPSYFTQHHDKNNKTAKELFKEKHATQLKEAQQWIKETSQSCSGVAVLVSTVVFAAAFTVPGGTNDDNGLPILIHSPFFMFFTVTDVVSLSCSLTAVVMFLSILTSPFQLHNFRITLPRRLTIGFALLFMSVATTMLAFTSTVILIIRSDQHRQWTLTLICCAAFVPVSVLALTHFPLFVSFIKAWSYPCSSLLRILAFLGKLVFQRGLQSYSRISSQLSRTSSQLSLSR